MRDKPGTDMPFTTMIGLAIMGALMWAIILIILFIGVTIALADTDDDLASIRYCESRYPENPNAYWEIDPSGTYFGAYQFDLPTWYSVGGTGLPNEATQAEQDYRASILYASRGRQPWANCFA